MVETNQKHGPNGAPPEAAPVFLIILYQKYLWIFLICSLYMFPKYDPCIFPCVFLNLWSQEKTSPYRKTTFLLLFFRFYTFYIFTDNFVIFIKINDFWTKSGPYGPIWTSNYSITGMRLLSAVVYFCQE